MATVGAHTTGGTADVDVLVVSVRWPPETFIMRTLETLRSHGVSVQLCVSTLPGQRVREERGMRVIELPSWDVSHLRRLGTFVGSMVRALRYPRSLTRLIAVWYKELRYRKVGVREGIEILYRLIPFAGVQTDVIHFQWNGGAMLYAALVPLVKRPVVISCRGSQIRVIPKDPANAGFAEALRESFSKADVVHCVSDEIRNVAGSYGAKPEKMVVIRPAVDPDFFSKAEPPVLSNRPFRIVSVGRLVWQKGFEYALSAVRRLLDLNVDTQFEIIGDGPDEQRLEFAITDLGLESHARLRGRLSPEGVRDALQHADAFLLTSVSEGISNAVLEAMACGCPPVATDVGGMSEAVTDGVDGFVVPARDTEAMAHALKVLAEDPDLRSKMGQRARDRMLADFNLLCQGAQFARLYRHAAGIL